MAAKSNQPASWAGVQPEGALPRGGIVNKTAAPVIVTAIPALPAILRQTVRAFQCVAFGLSAGGAINEALNASPWECHHRQTIDNMTATINPMIMP